MNQLSCVKSMLLKLPSTVLTSRSPLGVTLQMRRTLMINRDLFFRYRTLKGNEKIKLTPYIARNLPSTTTISARHFSANDPRKKLSANRMGMLTSLGVGASFLIGKTKYLFAALKLTKAAPLVSMMITSFTYSFIFGWPYACGMVGLIFCHECGHAVVMHQYGVPFSPMVFVPFMGAVIAMKEQPRNAYEEALIAFGGPVAGSAAAAAVATAAVATDSQLLFALADFGYMINLFNLLPIGSMDGGRIANAVSPWFGAFGLVGGGALIYVNAISNPIFYLIMLGGTYTTGKRLLGWDEDDYREYYKIPREKQVGLVGGLVALVGALLYGMQANNKYRKTPRQLQHAYTYDDDLSGFHHGGYDHFGTQDGGNVYDDYFSDKGSSRGF